MTRRRLRRRLWADKDSEGIKFIAAGLIINYLTTHAEKTDLSQLGFEALNAEAVSEGGRNHQIKLWTKWAPYCLSKEPII